MSNTEYTTQYCQYRDNTGYAVYTTKNTAGRIAQLVERPTEKPRRSTDAGSSPWCGKGFFSQSQLSVQTLLRCPYSPCVQSRGSTSVCTLKIPHTGSHTIVWTHENTALVATVPLPGRATRISSTVPFPGRATRISSTVPFPGRATRISSKGTVKY